MKHLLCGLLYYCILLIVGALKAPSCGGDIRGTTGFIRSPNFPDPYPNNTECIWVISVSAPNTIALQIEVFLLHDDGNCSDYLEIRDGAFSSSPLLAKLCPQNGLYEGFTVSEFAYIRFVSDVSGTSSGFELDWEYVPGSGEPNIVGAIFGLIFLAVFLIAWFFWCYRCCRSYLNGEVHPTCQTVYPTFCDCREGYSTNTRSRSVNSNSHRPDRISSTSASQSSVNTSMEMETVNTERVSTVSENLPPSYNEVMQNTTKFPAPSNSTFS